MLLKNTGHLAEIEGQQLLNPSGLTVVSLADGWSCLDLANDDVAIRLIVRLVLTNAKITVATPAVATCQNCPNYIYIATDPYSTSSPILSDKYRTYLDHWWWKKQRRKWQLFRYCVVLSNRLCRHVPRTPAGLRGQGTGAPPPVDVAIVI